MRAYLAIKFHEDYRNKRLIEEILDALDKSGFETTTIVRDYEKWGKIRFKPKELMDLAFKLIRESDFLIIEFSEKGIGLGIEAGYAYSMNIPIIILAKKGSDISETMKGIAKELIFYEKPEELEQKLKEIQI
ncbi:MAG: nucleoside 2-deoxyribosyltransferase [Nanoarchaeota archaeon]|nr:nucleoside 2-deoxyribosyltransferase [Nanoarchaeota archaeon]MBU4284419.1 nucleoside 2-deoxyribosyltransferase [Nanoarchaeota archaeon]MBU4492828.1 nucleoside 2-deoxyribosyltransferase [Nanoarchaeota archaeon]